MQNDEIQPQLRIGISLGEVIVADNTLTGAGVVLAQRLEQLAESGGSTDISNSLFGTSFLSHRRFLFRLTMS